MPPRRPRKAPMPRAPRGGWSCAAGGEDARRRACRGCLGLVSMRTRMTDSPLPRGIRLHRRRTPQCRRQHQGWPAGPCQQGARGFRVEHGVQKLVERGRLPASLPRPRRSALASHLTHAQCRGGAFAVAVAACTACAAVRLNSMSACPCSAFKLRGLPSVPHKLRHRVSSGFRRIWRRTWTAVARADAATTSSPWAFTDTRRRTCSHGRRIAGEADAGGAVVRCCRTPWPGRSRQCRAQARDSGQAAIGDRAGSSTIRTRHDAPTTARAGPAGTACRFPGAPGPCSLHHWRHWRRSARCLDHVGVELGMLDDSSNRW